MNNIFYKIGNEIDQEKVRKLYEDAGWSNYTKDMTKLMKAVKSSLTVISAWEDNELVGLVRAVGDGYTILYIQDILVLQSCKRRGIGSELIKRLLEEHRDVRQKVLLTDESQETRGFYEANGFMSCDRGQVVAFARFD